MGCVGPEFESRRSHLFLTLISTVASSGPPRPLLNADQAGADACIQLWGGLHDRRGRRSPGHYPRTQESTGFGRRSVTPLFGQDGRASSLELGIYGAAPMAPSLLERCLELFTENYSTAYGMTEMGPCATFIRPEEVRDQLGSVGRAAPNHEVRVVEPTETETPGDPVTPDDTVPQGETGETILHGPPRMREYWGLPEQTADALRDGWFFTGDAGYLNEDGYLFLVDRVDDVIISGGENIYPTEVENILYEHERVDEVAVVGAEDDEWGERVAAYVVGTADRETLDAYCRDHDELAGFKRPRESHLIEELPRNPSGKIQKSKLRERDTPAETVNPGWGLPSLCSARSCTRAPPGSPRTWRPGSTPCRTPCGGPASRTVRCT